MIPGSFDLTLPDGWVTQPAVPGCALLAGEPGPADGAVRPCVSLVFEDVPDDLEPELETFYRTQQVSMRYYLTDLVVIDEQPATLADTRAVVATIAYRQGRDGFTMRQWSALVDGCGVLLAAACPNERFPVLRPLLDEVAASLALGEPVAR